MKSVVSSIKVSEQDATNSVKLQQMYVVVPSPNTLSWDACSMTHLETHSPMHLK
jgi:hypothetical protein